VTWRAAERGLLEAEPGSPAAVELAGFYEDAKALYGERFVEIDGPGSFDTTDHTTAMGEAGA
jgi:hypothetical protein